MSTERSDMARLGFALADGLFVAAIVLLATTITPAFSPGVSWTGGIVLTGAAVCAVGTHVWADRRGVRESLRPRSGGRVLVRWLAELLCIVAAVAIVLAGGPVGLVAAVAGLLAAGMSFTVTGARTRETPTRERQ